ncbi:MAG: chromosomal replication initiator protein DnaA [Alphaproteobacteria bacterium]|nr:chromosomal replication initiator protein DnaA [Alphaproteobacteria bacterium]
MEKTETLCQQWNTVCGQLQQELGDSIAIRWLTKFVPTRLENNQLHLMAPSPCIKELIKKNYGSQILSLFQLQNPAITDVKFGLKSTVCDTKALSAANRVTVSEQTPTDQSPAQQSVPTQPTTVTPQSVGHKIVDADGEVVSSYLDPSHTFDSFVVGPSNAFAYNAAKRIAEEKDISFNPLYLHSSVGLGKTHLMHAIAWRIQDMHPGKSVLYLSAEQFFHRFVKAIRTHSTESFRNLFRSVDVLMIDDVQFIFGKKTTQEEFFHTFNALITSGKKIILSADSAPADLAGIEERLKTRIAQGLVVDIHQTCYDLRFGILKDKVTQKGLSVPHDVLDFLAKRVTSNIRELEGALNRIIAHSQWMGSQINLETVRRILKDVLRINERVVHITDIQRMTAVFYGLTIADLKSTRRERRIARPRQLAMYMAKQMTTLSVPDIALHFGRDHTTIMHAVKQIENLLKRDHKLGQDMQTLMYRLKEGDNE